MSRALSPTAHLWWVSQIFMFCAPSLSLLLSDMLCAFYASLCDDVSHWFVEPLWWQEATGGMEATHQNLSDHMVQAWTMWNDPFDGSKPLFTWFSKVKPCEIMKMRDLMVQRTMWNDVKHMVQWWTMWNGPVDGSKPRFIWFSKVNHIILLLMIMYFCDLLAYHTVL